MIAIFRSEDIKYTLASPSKEFKIIRSLEDIRGRVFTGIITAPDWHRECTPEVLEAFEKIKERQPELFKEFLRL